MHQAFLECGLHCCTATSFGETHTQSCADVCFHTVMHVGLWDLLLNCRKFRFCYDDNALVLLHA
jgi:hypothetical protein